MNDKITELAEKWINGELGRGRAIKKNIEEIGHIDLYDDVKIKVNELRKSVSKEDIKNSNDENEKSDVKEENTKETLTPAEYFSIIKDKITEETPENIKRLYDVTISQLKKFMVTGQKAAAKDLYARCLYLEKEIKLLEKGVTKYVNRTDIDDYVDNVADDCVCVIELHEYERNIPDEIIDIVANTKDIFDEFFVVFTDYTGEVRSKVDEKKRDKDPIIFGNIFIDGQVSPKMYFLGDWVDDYCDLTLDKMISDIAKKKEDENTEIVHNIEDRTTIEAIEAELFGENSTKLKSVAGSWTVS